MEIPFIETPRLLLKNYSLEAYQAVFKEKTDSEVLAIFGYSDLEEVQAEKQKYADGFSYYYRLLAHFQLVLKSTGQTIGSAGFHNWHPFHQRAELGYSLRKEEFKNKGYMSEAIGPIINYGFTGLKLHRIEASVEPGNIISLKMMAKFGFTREGLMKEHYFHEDTFEDSLLFRLLASEWENR
jgi:ribosomal-protein-alanine N-acetyltransferase